jgi:hypothetical protein
MKAYFLYAGDPYEGGFAFIEPSSREAMRKHRSRVQSDLDCEFIEVRCKLIKNANIEGLPQGEIECNKDTVKRGIFGTQDFEDHCDTCNQYRYLSLIDDNTLICSDCEDKL